MPDSAPAPTPEERARRIINETWALSETDYSEGAVGDIAREIADAERAAEERERKACARLCDNAHADAVKAHPHLAELFGLEPADDGETTLASLLAAVIRARGGEKEKR